jgi:hypothetical protein
MNQGWICRRAVIAIFILSYMFSTDVWSETASFGRARGRPRRRVDPRRRPGLVYPKGTLLSIMGAKVD